jgi:hypothetical protein
VKITLRLLSIGILAAGFAGCAGDESDIGVGGSDPTAPAVERLVTSSQYGTESAALTIGEPLHVIGTGFMSPSADDWNKRGLTKLVFNGIYVTDEGGTIQSHNVSDYTLAPVYDGRFIEAGKFEGVNVGIGTEVLRWNRFGPWHVPFGVSNKPGTFKGTVTPLNEAEDGETYRGEPTEVQLEVKASIIVKRLEPITAWEEDRAVTPGCGGPALRGIGGLAYILEFEAMGFEPEYWFVDISGVNGVEGTFSVNGPANGQSVVVGDPFANTSLPSCAESTSSFRCPVVFDPLAEDVDSRVMAIKIRASSSTGETFETGIPLSVVRPLGFHYDGNYELAEYYEPVPVAGPIIGAIGTTVSYSETKSESRQRGVSLGMNRTWTQSQGEVNSESWSEGVAESQSLSKSNSQGVAHSESESSSESYGQSYSTSENTSTNASTTDGSNWGWQTSEAETEESYEAKTKDLSGEISGSVATSVGAKGSVPGFAEVSGNVTTTAGAKVGTKVGNTEGERVGSKTETGNHMSNSSSETVAYGSSTSDSKSQSISGTYALSSQKSLSETTSQTEATSNSKTFSISGSGSVSKQVGQATSESWNETWSSTTTQSESLSINSKVPRDRCAMVYRQTVRYVRVAQVYNYDLCGVRSLAGEAVFNEWSWTPNIAVADECEDATPTLPKAECFMACE